MAPERTEIPNPFTNRATRFEGARTNSNTPNRSQYQANIEEGVDVAGIVNAVSGVSGLGAQMYIDYASEKVNADKVVQTSRAFQGLNPTDDATVAGYKSHALVKTQGDLAKAKIELKLFADSNPTDEAWDEKIREVYSNNESTLLNAYSNRDGDDAEVITDLKSLSSLALSQTMPEVTSYRELKRIEAEEASRMASVQDTMISEAIASPSMSPEAMAQRVENQMSGLALSPADRETTFTTAILNTSNPKLLEASKHYYGGRKTSLFERTGKLQVLDKKLQKEAQAELATESASFNASNEQAYMAGELTEEEWLTTTKIGKDKYGQSYTVAGMTAIINKHDKAVFTATQTETQVNAMINGDYTGEIKKKDAPALLSNVYSTMLETEMNGITDNPDATPEDTQNAVARTVSKFNDIIARHNVTYPPHVAMLESFATMSVDASSVTDEQGVRILNDHGTGAISVINAMTPEVKEMYFRDMPTYEQSVIRNFMVLDKEGFNSAQALEMAQSNAKAPSISRGHKALASASDSVFDELDTIFTFEVDEDTQSYLQPVIENMLKTFSDPASETAISHVKGVLETGWTKLDNGQLVEGNTKYFVDKGKVNESRISTSFDAVRDLNIPALERSLQATSGKWTVSDLIPQVDKTTDRFRFVTPDGEIIGSSFRVRDLQTALVEQKNKLETDDAELSRGSKGFWHSFPETRESNDIGIQSMLDKKKLVEGVK